MGIDCKMCVEIKTGHFWELVGVQSLLRHSEGFNIIMRMANTGYPEDISYMARAILDEYEEWGECWMEAEKFFNIFGRDTEFIKNVYKKKAIPDMRFIFRFDN